MALSTRGHAEAKVTLVTHKKVDRLLRDVRGRFLPEMQSNLANAHKTMMYIYQYEVDKSFFRKQSAYPTGNRRGKSRGQSQIHKALVTDFDINPMGRLQSPHMNWSIDVEKELNERVRDPETGKQYFRAVEYGYSRSGAGHLFYSAHPLGAGGRFSSPGANSMDPRMPRVGAGTEFTYSFKGYDFVQDGIDAARRRLNREAKSIYLADLNIPPDMRAALLG